MAITLKRFRCFVALAEELHFGRAAMRVFLSQPALSKQIALLEEDLETKLFERSPRAVALTEAGRVLLPEARLALEQVGRAERSVRRLQNETLLKLRLGSVGPAASSLLPEILKTLRATHPELVISLNELPTTEQLELLENDLIDLALLCAENTPETAFYPIYRDPVVLGVPEDHLLAQCAKVSLASLGEQTLASPYRIEPGHARLLSFLHAHDIYPEVIEVTGVATAFGLVATGAAVSFFPAFAQFNAPSGITFLPTEPPLPELETGVAWRRADPPAILEAFLQAAEQIKTAQPEPR